MKWCPAEDTPTDRERQEDGPKNQVRDSMDTKARLPVGPVTRNYYDVEDVEPQTFAILVDGESGDLVLTCSRHSP